MTKERVTKLVLCLALVCAMVLGTVRTSFAMNATGEGSPQSGEVSEISADEEEENEETVKADAASTEEAETEDGSSDNQEEAPIEVPEGNEEDAEGAEDAEDADDAEAEDVDEDPAYEEITLTAKGPDYTIAVICEADAEIDPDTELTVEEYDSDSKTYQARYEEAEEIYGWEDGEEPQVRLFDVSLRQDGKEVEPAASVQVEITYLNAEPEDAGTDDYTILHFADETEEIQPEMTADEEGEHLSFEVSSFSDLMVLAGDGTYQYVILNIGNENGSYRDDSGNLNRNTGYWPYFPIAGSSGARYGYGGNPDGQSGYGGYGDDWRITAAIPVSYFTNDRLTITLPCDSDLPESDWHDDRTTFYIYGNQNSSNSISVLLPRDHAYDYTLVGWINIGTGEYISVRDGNVQVTINADDDNIFYADWEAATYNVGKNDGNVANTVSTDFVTVNMFDYNELFNLYSVENTLTGDALGTYTTTSGANSRKEDWQIGDYFYDQPVGSSSRARLGSTGSFAFYDGGSTSGENMTVQHFLGFPTGRGTQNSGSVGDHDSNDGNLVNISNHLHVTTADDPFFTDYLFNTNAEEDGIVGVHFVGTGDQLFKYGTVGDPIAEEEGYVGYYYYDSRYNAANYNQSEERFYVYNDPSDVEGASYKEGFFPYNTYSDVLNDADGSVNYFFGMSMNVQIYLPDQVGTEGANMVSATEPMIFNFSGDDDIWIFVDGELVADMSGVHNKSYASLNFNSGEVTITTTDTAGNKHTPVTSSSGEEGVNSINGMDAGRHTLTVYYLERGGNSSNMIVSFNVAPSWDYETDSLQTVDVEKTWYDADGKLIEDTSAYNLPDITVGLYENLTDEDYTVTSTGSGYEYSFDYTDLDGNTTTYLYKTDLSGGFVSLKIGDQEYTTLDEDGWVVDSKGDPLAKLDSDGSLWIITDTCVLNEENEWKYVWDLLDLDRNYCTKEFASDGAYKLKESSENTGQTTGAYWTPVGEDGIEGSVVGQGQWGPVILTDAAQHNESVGSLEEAEGFVVVCGEDGTLSLKSVMFSEHATFELTTDEEGTPYYHSRLGVCSAADIEALGDGARWYFEESGQYVTDISGSKVEAFYIYCDVGGTKYYLTVSNGTVTTSTQRSELFFYDSLGELIAYAASIDDPDLADELAVTIGNDNGELTLRASSNTVPGDNDVRVYTLNETFEITQTSAKYGNQLITYDMQIFKYEEDNPDKPLSGADFILRMTGDDGEIYYAVAEPAEDGDGKTVYQVTGWTANKDEATALTSGEDGYIRIKNINLGTYTLTETKAPAGHTILPDSIGFTITVDTDGSVTVTVDGSGDQEGIDSEADTLLIANPPVVTLPNTGGEGVWLFLVLGLALVGASLVVVHRRRRSLSA